MRRFLPVSRFSATALCCLLLANGACRRATVPNREPQPSPEPGQGPPAVEVSAALEKVLAVSQLPGLKWPDVSDVTETLRALYAPEPDGLVWFTGRTPQPTVPRIVAGLALAGEQGLDAGDYDADLLALEWQRLAAAGGGASAADRVAFDVGLSVATARLLSAVRLGRVDPETLSWGYEIARRPFDRVAAIHELRANGSLEQSFALLEPHFIHFERARYTLANYRKAEANGEPPALPELAKGKRVLPGQAWDGVPQLAARLLAFGDLKAPAAETYAATTRYEGVLVDAVKSFQRRHGLEANGSVGPETWAAASVSLAHRVHQIELAMERMRWLPELNQANIFVNLPLFRLWATDPQSGEEPLRMNVVVGKSIDHRTPVFIDEMQYIIFRPYWNPPYSIIRKEILPKARHDPGYFASQDMEIVPNGDDNAAPLPVTPENLDKVAAGRLFVRQRPGPKNSLGLAKFIFPNSDSIYMHGTPAQSLFSRARRDFSHGCIRLENPAAMAAWVLRDQPQWTKERIAAAMNGSRPTRVNLKKHLSVVLFYDTVHINSDGVVFFVDDIYGHDRTLEVALAKGYPYPLRPQVQVVAAATTKAAAAAPAASR